jgi:hypothetical protein
MFMRPKALMANKYDWLEDLTSEEEDMMLKALSICRIFISIRVKRPLCIILWFGSKAMASMSLLCPCNVVD